MYFMFVLLETRLSPLRRTGETEGDTHAPDASDQAHLPPFATASTRERAPRLRSSPFTWLRTRHPAARLAAFRTQSGGAAPRVARVHPRSSLVQLYGSQTLKETRDETPHQPDGRKERSPVKRLITPTRGLVVAALAGALALAGA